MWSVSHPGKNGHPQFDLSADEEATVSSAGLTPLQLSYEQVITKIFNHYEIPLDITDPIRQIFKFKLQRVGSALSKIGENRSVQLSKWTEGPNSIWNLQINKTEVTYQLLTRKRRVEAQLENEVTKCRKLQKEISELKHTNIKQAREIVKLKSIVGGHCPQRGGMITAGNINERKKTVWLIASRLLCPSAMVKGLSLALWKLKTLTLECMKFLISLQACLTNASDHLQII